MESRSVDDLLSLIAQSQAAEEQAKELRRQAQRLLPVARKAFGVTQTPVAEEAGVTQSYLSQIENVASSEAIASATTLLDIVNAIPVVAEGDSHGHKRNQGRKDARQARGE